MPAACAAVNASATCDPTRISPVRRIPARGISSSTNGLLVQFFSKYLKVDLETAGN
jgi:hypothetical protein